MNAIYKYPLPVWDWGSPVVVQMPDGAKVLHVVQQGEVGDVYLWVMVDTTAPTVPRTFVVRATGDQGCEIDGTYISTVLLLGGDIVVHVFETNAAAR